MKTKHIIIVILFVIITSYLLLNNKLEKVANSWKFEKVIGQTIYFSDNQQFNINLYDLKYVGQLSTGKDNPFLIVSGRTCRNCDENLAIYIYSPKTGLIQENNEPIRYSYPGKEYDYENNKLVFESRMFYGQCLDKNSSSIVWFQKELDPNEAYKESAFALEIIGENIKESIKKDTDLSIEQIIKNCNELPGIDVSTQP